MTPQTGIFGRLSSSTLLCALNFLSGDKYYLEFYQSDYDRLFPRLRPKERAAFVSLKHRIKDQNGGIISAQLALYFSATDAESLDDMIRVVKDSTAMQRNLKATSYYSDDGWKVYEESRGDLEAAFKALKRIHFEADWKKQVRPRIEKARASIAQDLPKYNVIPKVESVLGSPSPSSKITVYWLYYSEPHGIKITGARFLTGAADKAVNLVGCKSPHHQLPGQVVSISDACGGNEACSART